MKFHWSTIGHDAVKRYIESFVELSRIPAHAFILSGPEHIGKSTFARDMIAMLMCTDGQTRPCGSCVHCQHISRNAHPDVYSVNNIDEDAPKHRPSSITVESVREYLDQLQTHALFRHQKVLWVEHAELLTIGASNALLKTLEEPRGNTIFVLVSNSEEALLPTIRSRCLTIRMYPLPIQTIYRELINRSIPTEIAMVMARFSKGRFGLVSRFVDQRPEWDATQRQIELDVQTLFSSGADKHRWYEDSDSIPFLSFIDFVHDALLVSVGLPERAVTTLRSRDAFAHCDAGNVTNLLETCMRAVKLRSQNANSKLLLDLIHARVRNVV